MSADEIEEVDTCEENEVYVLPTMEGATFDRLMALNARYFLLIAVFAT